MRGLVEWLGYKQTKAKKEVLLPPRVAAFRAFARLDFGVLCLVSMMLAAVEGCGHHTTGMPWLYRAHAYI